MQKSEKIKILLIVSLLIFASILVFVRGCSNKEAEKIIKEKEEKAETKQLPAEELKKIIPPQIDSILYQYGINPEWIKNVSDNPSQEKPKKEKTKKPEKQPPKPVVKPSMKTDNLWFMKEITIPKDIPFAELNLEIVNLMNGYKLSSTSFEDPKTYNQLFNIYYTADTSKKSRCEN